MFKTYFVNYFHPSLEQQRPLSTQFSNIRLSILVHKFCRNRLYIRIGKFAQLIFYQEETEKLRKQIKRKKVFKTYFVDYFHPSVQQQHPLST